MNQNWSVLIDLWIGQSNNCTFITNKKIKVMTKMQDIDYPVGFSIFQLDAGGTYMITGTIAEKYRFRDFYNAYDLEEYIRKHIDCSDIDFDSEYCQFWAYSKTLDRAKQFVEEITAWVTKVKELVD